MAGFQFDGCYFLRRQRRSDMRSRNAMGQPTVRLVAWTLAMWCGLSSSAHGPMGMNAKVLDPVTSPHPIYENDCDVISLLNKTLADKGVPVWTTALTHTSCCSWPGIECDLAGHVTVLDVHNMGLNGILSQDIARYIRT